MEKERSFLKYRGEICLNCGVILDKSDRYCSNCGQLNTTKRLTFKGFLNEFFAGIFAYDSRINQTLKTILFKPGKITRDYINGKRGRYVNPFRFYLSVSIIFFIIYGLTTDNASFNNEPTTSNNSNLENLSPTEKEDINKKLDKIPGLKQKVNLDSISKIGQEDQLKTYRDFYKTQMELEEAPALESLDDRFTLYKRFHEETNIYQASVALDSLKHTQNSLNLWCYKKVLDISSITKNPKLFANYFLAKMPIFIFFYLPVFALFIWLVYFRRPFKYMEHLVFSFHVKAVFFILIGLGILIDTTFKIQWVTAILNLVFLFYLYKALRNFYKQGRVKTIVKFLLLNLIFFTLAIIAFIFSLFASFAIY